MAKRVTSLGELPSPSLLWLTLELQRGHFLKAKATDGEGQEGGKEREWGGPGESTMVRMLTHTAGWLTSPLAIRYPPFSLSPGNCQSVSETFRVLPSAVHNRALGLDY